MKLNFIAAATALILSLTSSSAQEATPVDAGALRRKLVSTNVRGPKCLRISGVPYLEGKYILQDQTTRPAIYKRQDGADIVIFSYVTNRGSQIYTASSENDFRRANSRNRFRISRMLGFCSSKTGITNCNGKWSVDRTLFTGSTFKPC